MSGSLEDLIQVDTPLLYVNSARSRCSPEEDDTIYHTVDDTANVAATEASEEGCQKTPYCHNSPMEESRIETTPQNIYCFAKDRVPDDTECRSPKITELSIRKPLTAAQTSIKLVTNVQSKPSLLPRQRPTKVDTQEKHKHAKPIVANKPSVQHPGGKTAIPTIPVTNNYISKSPQKLPLNPITTSTIYSQDANPRIETSQAGVENAVMPPPRPSKGKKFKVKSNDNPPVNSNSQPLQISSTIQTSHTGVANTVVPPPRPSKGEKLQMKTDDNPPPVQPVNCKSQPLEISQIMETSQTGVKNTVVPPPRPSKGNKFQVKSEATRNSQPLQISSTIQTSQTRVANTVMPPDRPSKGKKPQPKSDDNPPINCNSQPFQISSTIETSQTGVANTVVPSPRPSKGKKFQIKSDDNPPVYCNSEPLQISPRCPAIAGQGQQIAMSSSMSPRLPKSTSQNSNRNVDLDEPNLKLEPVDKNDSTNSVAMDRNGAIAHLKPLPLVKTPSIGPVTKISPTKLPQETISGCDKPGRRDVVKNTLQTTLAIPTSIKPASTSVRGGGGRNPPKRPTKAPPPRPTAPPPPKPGQNSLQQKVNPTFKPTKTPRSNRPPPPSSEKIKAAEERRTIHGIQRESSESEYNHSAIRHEDDDDDDDDEDNPYEDIDDDAIDAARRTGHVQNPAPTLPARPKHSMRRAVQSIIAIANMMKLSKRNRVNGEKLSHRQEHIVSPKKICNTYENEEVVYAGIEDI